MSKYISSFINRDNKVCLLQSAAHGKKVDVMRTFIPYFWADLKDFEKNSHKILTDLRHIITIVEEKRPYVKIYYKYSWDNWTLLLNYFSSKDIKTFELDVRPDKLYCVENIVDIEDDYDMLYYDIETDDRRGGINIGASRIISICAIDNNGKEYVFCYDDEVSILQDFIDCISKYDVIAGYNSKGFDLPFIKERLKLHNIYFDFKTVQCLDIMELIQYNQFLRRKMSEMGITSMSLDNVASKFIGEEKKHFSQEDEGYGGRLYDMFVNNKAKLIKYNLQDCKLLKKLDAKLNLTKTQIYISVLSKTFLQFSVATSNIIDNIVLREAKIRNYHYPTVFRTTKELRNTDPDYDFPGGYVFDAVPGLHKNVGVFDFSGLYPSIIRTFNISHDTLSTEGVRIIVDDTIRINNVRAKRLGLKGIDISSPIHLSMGYRKIYNDFIVNKTCYSLEKRGIIPTVLDEYQELRLKYKKEKETAKKQYGDESPEYVLASVKEIATKVIVLSMYGILGAKFSRFFDTRIAASITLTGQHLIKSVAKKMTELGYIVVEGDTDSCFFKAENMKEIIDGMMLSKIKTVLESIMTTEYSLRKHCMQMGLEKAADKAIVLSKKRYSLHVVYENGKVDKLYNRGVEFVRGDFCQIGKRFFDDIFKLIFEDEIDYEKLKDVVLDYKKKIICGEATGEELAITLKISKMPEEFKGKNVPAHVRIAMRRKNTGVDRYYVSQKIPFIITKSHPIDGVHLSEFDGDYDGKFYWTNKIWPPIRRILEKACPDFDWELHNNPDFGVMKNLFHFLKSPTS